MFHGSMYNDPRYSSVAKQKFGNITRKAEYYSYIAK